ncbi:MAG: energy transducer TonB [Rhodobacterales bacterium]|nr:energy transducer TonB [Rhodobacterales bacterium]
MARRWTSPKAEARRAVDTGQIISGAGHIGLIAWLLFGGWSAPDPLDFEVNSVTTVSLEEYAAILSGTPVPEQPAEVSPAAPQPPEEPQEAPDLTSASDAAPDAPPPDPASEAAPDTVPQPPAPPARAEVSDEPPSFEPPAEDMAALVPESALRPKQRPAERVAPEQVAPPEPDTKVDEVVREEAVPDEAAETPSEEVEATAPEAAATEIVTEAQQPAPSRSVRPKSRPNRPAPPPESERQTAEAAPRPEPEAAPDGPAETGGIEDALAAALGAASDTPAPAAPSAASDTPAGPPLTAGEKDSMRIAVQSCWNVGSLSSDALATTVTVAFEMTEDARPIDGTIRMISSSGGTAGSANQAYDAARRAIIRCGARGFALPVEKYASWRNVELVFNPENMRIK